MKTNTERRNFFKKAGLKAISAGVMSLIPLKLFAQNLNASKNPRSISSSPENVNITINPMAVKREKRK